VIRLNLRPSHCMTPTHMLVTTGSRREDVTTLPREHYDLILEGLDLLSLELDELKQPLTLLDITFLDSAVAGILTKEINI